MEQEKFELGGQCKKRKKKREREREIMKDRQVNIKGPKQGMRKK